MIPRVNGWRIGLFAAGMAGACTPPLDPPWVLSRPRELGMQIAVVRQGPYGQALDPTASTVNEALPLDTILATPFIAGPDGIVDLGMLSPRWYVCNDSGACLLRVEPDALPPCTGTTLIPDEPCSPSGDATLTLTLGDFVPSESPDATFALNRAPTLGLVASTEAGPGTEACLRHIADRTALEGCLWMERTVSLGPLSEVVDALTALGYEVDVSESLAPLLDVPRNHNPEVRALTVTVDGGPPVAYDVGSTVEVTAGASITVQYEPDDDDLDAYTVELDGELLQIEDRLDGRWYASREVDAFVQDAAARSVAWQATRADPVTLYFVLRDDRRAEAWGWLRFDPR